MSLKRLNKIAVQLFKGLLTRKYPKLAYATQRAAENVLRTIGPSIISRPSKLPYIRKFLFRVFKQATRHRAPQLLRPFATLHFNRQHLRDLDQHRKDGLLNIPVNEGKRDVFQRVRHIFGTNLRYNRALAVTEMPQTLDGYEIGEYICRGCSGAVYELKVIDQQMENGENGRQQQQQSADSLKHYPLALKLMFNYEFGVSDRTLCTSMGHELIPLAPLPSSLLEGGKMANIKTLPRAHPNVIKLHTAFIDIMPILPGAHLLYPDALPELDDIDPTTLFVVMKRYRMTLQQYVISRKRNYWVGRVMFGQLLEAIVYLHQNHISHRDMKSNNILLDFNNEEEVPHLVLSDFGSALATGNWLVEHRNGADLGGNLALMAPEVRRSRPGPNSIVDFEMADTWSAGTLAFEIFTRRNPFYAVLSSENYMESQLPPLPTRLIGPIQRIIGDMLRIDPSCRPRPEIAANVVAISLFRFGKDLRQFFRTFGLHWFWSMENMRSTFSNVRHQMEAKIRDMTELYATETILARFINPVVISSAELQLRATFLARVNTEELRTALDYFFDDKGMAMDGGWCPPNGSGEASSSTEAYSSSKV